MTTGGGTAGGSTGRNQNHHAAPAAIPQANTAAMTQGVDDVRDGVGRVVAWYRDYYKV